MPLADLLIRSYQPDDVDLVLRIRHAAVHQIARGVYNADVLDGWSGPLDQTIVASFNKAGTHEVRLIAARAGAIVGYGAFQTHDGEMQGIYTVPGAIRQGVGSRLARELETEALRLGLKYLWINSPFNAIEFFKANNFEFITDGYHKLHDGREIACARMRLTVSGRG